MKMETELNPYPLTIPYLIKLDRNVEDENQMIDICTVKKDMDNNEAFNLFMKVGIEHIDINKNLIIDIDRENHKISFASKKGLDSYPSNLFSEFVSLTHKNVRNIMDDGFFSLKNIGSNGFDFVTKNQYNAISLLSLKTLLIFIKYNIKSIGCVYDLDGINIYISQENLGDFLHNMFSNNVFYDPKRGFFDENQHLAIKSTGGGKIE